MTVQRWLSAALLAAVLGSGCGDTPEVVPEPPDAGPREPECEAQPDLTPMCCGCLCADDHWSCGAPTCVNAAGQAVGLSREVGFLQLDEERPGQIPANRFRLWYAFFPADEAPEEKPVLLLFNGGPGSPPRVMGLGTGPTNLHEAEVKANPHSWTRFANLLYVDPPDVGFSYSLADTDGPHAELDASLHLRALLAFLERHPALRANRIGLVGESWGGVRATLMLHMALHYDDPNARLPGERLHEELAAHFAALFGGDGHGLTPGEVAAQFAFQILIQPTVGVQPPLRTCPDDPEAGAFKCDEPAGWITERTEHMRLHLLDPDDWQPIYGTDLGTVAWMLPAARTDVRRGWYYGETNEMAAELGALTPWDTYYVKHGSLYIGSAYPPGCVARFVDNLPFVKTLVTNARLDAIVVSDELPAQLEREVPRVLSARYDEQPRAGEARPGWVRLELNDDAGGPASAEFRMPRYAEAGHMVALSQPRELAEDVAALLADGGTGGVCTQR